jgi:hypothetical protein
MSESNFEASANPNSNLDTENDGTSGCPQCGAVGTAQWRREDGVIVCEECWVEMGPPVLPKPEPRFRLRHFRRRRAIRMERKP